MAFGIKIKRVNLSRAYTYEELAAALQQKTDWSCGAPTLTKHGFTQVIVFPPIDRQNQVWVQLLKPKGSEKVQVFLSHDLAGDFGNMAKNQILDSLTGGLSNMGSAFGKKAKAGEALVDECIAGIESLGL